MIWGVGGKTTTCLHADGNNQAKRKKLMMQSIGIDAGKQTSEQQQKTLK